MKHFIPKAILALGASSILLLAQSSTPQNPQQRTPRSTDPSAQTTPSGSQTSDTAMAAKVRQALMDDQTVGTAAHNVRVTSHNGTVLLKGKVSSEQEKDAIVSKAKQVAGDSNIKDEITVAKSK